MDSGSARRYGRNDGFMSQRDFLNILLAVAVGLIGVAPTQAGPADAVGSSSVR
jgi:hypothetical protein